MYELRQDTAAALEAKAEVVVAAEARGDVVWFAIIPEEEEPAMPARTVTSVDAPPCGTSAYVRIDPSPLAGRTMILIMNPDPSDPGNRLAVIVSNSDSIPAPSTPPSYVVEAQFGVNPSPLQYADQNVRHYGKALTGSITPRVTQGAPT